MAHISLAHTFLDPVDNGEDWGSAVLSGNAQVYACLDANRIMNLPEILQSSDLPHCCLFQGELAETAGQQAPWLIALGGKDRLLHQLLTSHGPDQSDPFAYREAEAGIYIHTTMPLADLRKHLRRFLRVRSLDGRNFLFRFWEPSIAVAYFSGFDQRPELINRWFRSREDGLISSIVVADLDEKSPKLIHFTPNDLSQHNAMPTGVFTLSNEDIARFGVVRMDRDILQLSARLTETFPQAAQTVQGGSIDDFTRATVSRMMQFGFGKKSALFTLLAWELHYGPHFETRDPDGQLGHILHGNQPQNEKLERLKKRMSAMV